MALPILKGLVANYGKLGYQVWHRPLKMASLVYEREIGTGEAHDQILVSWEKLTLFVNKLRTFFPAIRTSRSLIDTCSTSPANHELRSQANGVFENHYAWLQAFPSFPSPTPSFLFLLSPHCSRGQNAENPRFFFALCSTETLATQAKAMAVLQWKFSLHMRTLYRTKLIIFRVS